MVPKVWNLSVSRSSCLPWPQWSQAPGWNLCPTIHTKSLFLAFGHAFHFIFKLPILNSGPFAWDPNNCLPLVSLMWLDPRWGSGSIWICSPRNKLGDTKRGSRFHNHKELNSASNSNEQETDSPLEPPGRNRVFQHLDFHLVKSVLDFLPTEL